jgi:8-oxo-dGTP diphosphatase
MEVNFHELGSLNEELLGFVTIPSKYKGKWIFVRHKERETWEVPGGHIEIGECVLGAAKRELFEESGAIEFDIHPICDFSVAIESRITYGRLFIAEVGRLGDMPNFEIGEIKLFDHMPDNLTYPHIYNELFRVLENR